MKNLLAVILLFASFGLLGWIQQIPQDTADKDTAKKVIKVIEKPVVDRKYSAQFNQTNRKADEIIFRMDSLLKNDKGAQEVKTLVIGMKNQNLRLKRLYRSMPDEVTIELEEKEPTKAKLDSIRSISPPPVDPNTVPATPKKESLWKRIFGYSPYIAWS